MKRGELCCVLNGPVPMAIAGALLFDHGYPWVGTMLALTAGVVSVLHSLMFMAMDDNLALFRQIGIRVFRPASPGAPKPQ